MGWHLMEPIKMALAKSPSTHSGMIRKVSNTSWFFSTGIWSSKAGALDELEILRPESAFGEADVGVQPRVEARTWPRLFGSAGFEPETSGMTPMRFAGWVDFRLLLATAGGLDGKDLVQRRVGIFKDFDARVVVVVVAVVDLSVVEVVVEFLGQIWDFLVPGPFARKWSPV